MPQILYPVFRYSDASAAIDWLERAFGFQRGSVYEDGGVVHHAELHLDGAWIMLGSAAGQQQGDQSTAQAPGSGSVYAVIADPDAHHAQAKEAGAEIVRELCDQDYGSREYSARDLEGNIWSFGTYRPAAPTASV